MASFEVTCNHCGYSADVDVVKLHSCQIQEQGGRCEDYPACAHTDGDGCQTRLEHTMDYWTDMFTRYPDMMDQWDGE